MLTPNAATQPFLRYLQGMATIGGLLGLSHATGRTVGQPAETRVMAGLQDAVTGALLAPYTPVLAPALLVRGWRPPAVCSTVNNHHP